MAVNATSEPGSGLALWKQRMKGKSRAVIAQRVQACKAQHAIDNPPVDITKGWGDDYDTELVSPGHQLQLRPCLAMLAVLTVF